LEFAGPGDLEVVAGLVLEAADWLGSKGSDQWQEPWPDRAAHRERILNDLLKGKTRVLRDGVITAATITIDTEEPLVGNEWPVWPSDKSPKPAVYVRRVVVGRRYARRGLGAALLDWAAAVAKRDHGAELIRVDVWTTNETLHAYYKGQHFTRCPDPQGLGDYPSQALFERAVDAPASDFARFFLT
jgi:GNAT superfamily N-acetyltransferase